MLKGFSPTRLPDNVDLSAACKFIARGLGGKGAMIILLHWNWGVEIGGSHCPEYTKGLPAALRTLADSFAKDSGYGETIRKSKTGANDACQKLVAATKTRGAVVIVIQPDGGLEIGMSNTPEFDILLPHPLKQAAAAIELPNASNN
jgi:hypothetical protein